ncbi:hypothetical protein AS034_09040 [[Bacillus] enclensis]|uniref:DUF1850 domain-containing protein n=1 Tax=[Bacillus] enclensis TaxID=1402860 RepID=A0A0V8HIL7_9BACI|nr:DUF1850 domain-containing protein [[Bacillus] enclensis]KSU62264.1 hypothetical protein AS034_09040 [[Bacillus] enclensis]OAT83210.1 hypothetical protein A6P54_06370 [Bacillus sp. MKU004]QWC24223.1 DUF1850 domain-containing protein [Bacillus haikouensis]SCC01694.1 protein of unknown function [[Bacillus] enclensis]
MKRKYMLWSALLFLILTSFIFLPLQTFLVIEPREYEDKPAYFSISKDQSFSILYTHSIHLSEVEEIYRQTPANNIRQTKLLYEDTAIGMPSDAEGREVFSRTKDGRYAISNMDREFPFIDIQIGQVVANHRLVYDGEVYPLKEYFKEGSIVRMHFKKVSLFSQWKGVIVVGKR